MWWRAAPSRWRICLAGREQGAMWWRAAPSRWRVFLALPVAIGSQKQPDGGNCQTGGEAVRKGYRVTGVSEHDRHTVRDRSLDGWGSSSSFNIFRPLNLLTAYPDASDPRPPWTPFNAVDAGKNPLPCRMPLSGPLWVTGSKRKSAGIVGQTGSSTRHFSSTTTALTPGTPRLVASSMNRSKRCC
jgi:hypothetical protein